MAIDVFRPFDCSQGPKDAKIVFVGEAFGQQEDLVKLPFQGAAGQELHRMLKEAGIERQECFFTNVFNFRPIDNNLESICVKKGDLPKDYNTAPLRQGKYVPPEYFPHLERLFIELDSIGPNLVVALGAVACWALLQTAGIRSIRGTVRASTTTGGLKVLPTFHPAYVLRDWAVRPIVIADLMKARREMAFPDIRLPEREVLINPTLEEIWAYANKSYPILSIDVETKMRQIDSIGFAATKKFAIVIPFIKHDGTDYWDDPADEVSAVMAVKQLCESPCPKLFQNGLYDLQYITQWGIRPRNVSEDTMLRHHALFPEMQKSLGFLGSIYTDESSWKLLRKDKDSTKADE